MQTVIHQGEVIGRIGHGAIPNTGDLDRLVNREILAPSDDLSRRQRFIGSCRGTERGRPGQRALRDETKGETEGGGKTGFTT